LYLIKGGRKGKKVPPFEGRSSFRPRRVDDTSTTLQGQGLGKEGRFLSLRGGSSERKIETAGSPMAGKKENFIQEKEFFLGEEKCAHIYGRPKMLASNSI